MSGIPWKAFGRDFVFGTEADGEPLKGLYYARMTRAYRRPTGAHEEVDAVPTEPGGGVEVWMHVGRGRRTPRGDENDGRRAVDFAVAACTGGAPASLGGDHPDLEAVALSRVAEQIIQRGPYLNLPSVPGIALHLSQQTETFVFGRDPGYPSAAQADAVMRYVHEGGVLVTGPWFGTCDEMAEGPSTPGVDRKLFPYGATRPTIAELTAAGPIAVPGAPANPADAVSDRSFGLGRVVQLATDIGTLFRSGRQQRTVEFVAALLRRMHTSVASVTVEDRGLVIGTYRRSDGVTVIHVQQFAALWDATAVLTARPASRWSATLTWHGTRPKSARVALPEVGPPLSMSKEGDGWAIDLPPFVWGQVVLVEAGEA